MPRSSAERPTDSHQLYRFRVLHQCQCRLAQRPNLIEQGIVSASKQYQKHKEPLFEEKVFFDLKNAQAVSSPSTASVHCLRPTAISSPTSFLPRCVLVRSGTDRL